MSNTPQKIIVGLLVVALLLGSQGFAAQQKNPRYPDTLEGESVDRLTRGSAATDKLTPELQSLFRQFSANRDKASKDNKFSDAELKKRFGITNNTNNPAVEVAIEVASDTDTTTLEKAGATIRLVFNQTVYASLPVLSLETLAREETVISISSVKAARLPEIPKAQKAPRLSLPDLTRGVSTLANAFDAQGLTGKGVIIGVLDTGIDWRHQDFINPDGTSRIVSLYDPFDKSFTTSQGKRGSRPPINDAKDQPLGTLYTREQLNAALLGQGTINSTDKNGHGTAVAGTAAGNGRATAQGVPAGTYKGTAPEADLIIVKVIPDSISENVFPYYLAAKWIVETAKAANKACVLNLSLGNHYSAHDGNDAVEAMFNELAGDGKQGVVICVAAGNEGKFSFHAGGTFGPRRTGQADIISPPIELFVARPTQLSAYFDHADDWGLIVSGMDNFFVDDKGNSLDAYFYNVEGRFQTKISAKAKTPASFSQFVQNAVEIEAPMKSSKSLAKSSAKPSSTSSTNSSVNQRNAISDRLVLTLQPGKYTIRGFGATQGVTNGRFDLYLDSYSEASFGNGAEAKFMIASPGNAANVLTVGAYDFRNQWENVTGKQTSYNLNIGDLADYSSPGYRRDGTIKPDIIAPATYTIATLATGSALAKDSNGNVDQTVVTGDGLHLAWSGTSAAAPYVAGVVALLLQKNPRLDASQIRDLLARTAIKDQFTGAVPNPRWGYGKINPYAAIHATREDFLPLETSASAKTPSSSSVSLAASLAVQVSAREEFILQAGELQGMTKGSRFALHAAEAADFKNATPIAEAEITELDNTTATLTLTQAFKGKLPVSDLKFLRAVEVAHQYGDNRLKIEARSLEALTNGKTLIEQLQSLPLVHITREADEKWDVRLRPSSTNRQSAEVLLERQDGTLLRQFTSDMDLLKQIRQALESESRSHFLKALENHDRDLQIKIELRVVPVKVELDDRGRIRRVIADKEMSPTNQQRMILTEGDFVMLEIKNTGSTDAYVTVFDLRSDGLIAPLFPHPSIKVYDNKIPVGDKWQRIPQPFIFHIEKPYGTEIFKAIATRDKTDFSMLLDAETLARSGDTEAARSPLGQLLKAAATGQRGALAAVAPAGWATASVTFEVVAHKE